jgi:hypothetical protein
MVEVSSGLASNVMAHSGREVFWPAVVHRALQIHVAVTAVLATVLLGMGQRNIDLPFYVLLAAVGGFIFTDLLGWIRLNFYVTNLLAGAVFLVLLLRNIIQLNGTAQMLAIANILVYMQIVCLFQEKDARTCWVLALLGLLQVVVAAALNQSVLFGMLLIAYLAFAPATLGLLCVFREIVGEESATPRRSRNRPAAESGFQPRARLSDQVQHQIIRHVRFHAGRVLGITLVLTLLIFFFAPRPRGQGIHALSGTALRSIGFSDRVRLGELGPAFENPQEVLRLKLSDAESGERYPVRGPVYLRGTILTSYTRGQWFHGGSRVAISLWPLPRMPVGRLQGLVKQDIVIEPLDRPELFCVWPVLNVQDNPGVLIDLRRMVLLRSADQLGSQFHFTLLTPAFHEGQQWLVMPTMVNPEADPDLLSLPPRDDSGGVPGLIALGEQWVKQLGLSRDDPYSLARIFERQLRDSGRFVYSLKGQPRDPNLDPVEDFITRNPRGHCEYFATALVLMLRSQGIPARLVVGYKTEEWNPLGGFFVVRQLHAHTWVEAYLSRDQVPADLWLDHPYWQQAHGAWLRLDPTPAPPTPLPARLFWGVWKWFDWVDYLWRQYVVELDGRRQEEVFYRPISALAGRVWKETSRLGSQVGTSLAALGRWLWAWGQSIIIPFTIIVATVGAMIILVVFRFTRVFPAVRGLLETYRKSPVAGVSARRAGGFYRRLELLLGHWGLRRRPGQTPREFALQAAAAFTQLGLSQEWIHFPSEVVSVFYAVRFGRKNLPESLESELDHRLGLLETIRRPRRFLPLARRKGLVTKVQPFAGVKDQKQSTQVGEN